MKKIIGGLDGASLAVLIITLAFFVAALFVKGITHDLFLEIGIFLISIKVIMLSCKHSSQGASILAKLDELKALLRKD
jgi:hypothetical protein